MSEEAKEIKLSGRVAASEETEEIKLSGRVAAVEVTNAKSGKPVTLYIPTTGERRFCIRKTGFAFFLTLEKAEGRVANLTKEGAPASKYVAFDEDGLLTEKGLAALAERFEGVYVYSAPDPQEEPESA